MEFAGKSSKEKPKSPRQRRRLSASFLSNASRSRSNSRVFLTDRVVNDVPFPRRRLLDDSELYGEETKPSLKILAEHLTAEGRLNIETAIRIVKEARGKFCKELNLLHLHHPITIAGDIHGQFYDLLTLFGVGGDPEQTKYLFLGDYVDRGLFSCEVVLYLFAIKLNYPKNIYLLRGNHECRSITQMFTFHTECITKYNMDFYEICMSAFDHLPIAAVINKLFFCAHAGISPEILLLDDIKKISRAREIPDKGPLCDLLWADPSPDYDDDNEVDFIYNSTRSLSFFFSYKALKKFLLRNHLSVMIRAHQLKREGYQTYKNLPNSKLPSLVTVFSAPNYNDSHKNKGAIIFIDSHALNVKQYSSVPHPYWLPNFENAISYTLPFIAEHTTNIVIALIGTRDEYRTPDQRSQSGLEIKNSVDETFEKMSEKIRILNNNALIFHNWSERNLNMIIIPDDENEECNCDSNN